MTTPIVTAEQRITTPAAIIETLLRLAPIAAIFTIKVDGQKSDGSRFGGEFASLHYEGGPAAKPVRLEVTNDDGSSFIPVVEISELHHSQLPILGK